MLGAVSSKSRLGRVRNRELPYRQLPATLEEAAASPAAMGGAVTIHGSKSIGTADCRIWPLSAPVCPSSCRIHLPVLGNAPDGTIVIQESGGCLDLRQGAVVATAK